MNAILGGALAPTQTPLICHRRNALSKYEHERLSRSFTELSRCPDDTALFEKWIEASDHLDLLRHNAMESELLICAINGQSFVQTAIVNEEKLCSAFDDNWLSWEDWHKPVAVYDEGSEQDELQIMRGKHFDNSKLLEDAYPLVFIRGFGGASKGPYLEALQEYVHLADTHWVSQNMPIADSMNSETWILLSRSPPRPTRGSHLHHSNVNR